MVQDRKWLWPRHTLHVPSRMKIHVYPFGSVLLRDTYCASEASGEASATLHTEESATVRDTWCGWTCVYSHFLCWCSPRCRGEGPTAHVAQCRVAATRPMLRIQPERARGTSRERRLFSLGADRLEPKKARFECCSGAARRPEPLPDSSARSLGTCTGCAQYGPCLDGGPISGVAPRRLGRWNLCEFVLSSSSPNFPSTLHAHSSVQSSTVGRPPGACAPDRSVAAIRIHRSAPPQVSPAERARIHHFGGLPALSETSTLRAAA